MSTNVRECCNLDTPLDYCPELTAIGLVVDPPPIFSVAPVPESPLTRTKKPCGGLSMLGSCAAGHHIARRLYCGAEYCTSCGKKGSPSHMRKVARQFTKIMSMPEVGYMVFPIPVEMKHLFIFPQWLKKMEQYCRRMLQRELPGEKFRGLSRWHFSGDCRRCHGRGVLFFRRENETVECPECDGTGLNDKWHPHLNILIDVGKIEKSVLERIKSLYRNWLRNYTGIELKNKKAVVLYRFYPGDSFTELRTKYRVCRYVLRPTFSMKTCIEYDRLYGMDPRDVFKRFRNTCEIGRSPAGHFFKTENLPVNVCKFIFSTKKYRILFNIGKGNTKCMCPICAEEGHDHSDHLEAKGKAQGEAQGEAQGDLFYSPWYQDPPDPPAAGSAALAPGREIEQLPEPQDVKIHGVINYVTFEMIIRTPPPWVFDRYGICELTEMQYNLASEWSRKPIMLQ